MTTSDTTASEGTTESEGTTISNTTAKQKSEAIGKVKVTDAYKSTFTCVHCGKITSKLPKLTIEGVDTKKINTEINSKYLKTAKKDVEKRDAEGSRCVKQKL